MIRLGLIGCGGMGGGFIHRLSELGDRLCVSALVDIDIDRANEVAKEAPGARVAADYRDVMDDVDAVIIALPHHLHHGVTLDILKADKHVLLEKPMANTEQQCLDLIAADRSPDPVLTIGYVMRYDPLWTEMGRLIREQVYGEVFHLSIWTEQLTHPPENSWHNKIATLGGGQLFSHGCHYIDLMLHWMGRPVEGMHIGTNFGTPWMEREGTSDVVIKFENGALGYHMGTWGARGSRLGYSVHAHTEQGMLELNHKQGRIYLHRFEHGDGDLPGLAASVPPGAALDSPDCATIFSIDQTAKATNAEVAAFLDCIEQKRKPETDARTALQSLRVIWRLYEAEDACRIADLRGLGLDRPDEQRHGERKRSLC